MAVSYSTSARNAMMDALNTDINTGAGNALIRIYSGTRPAAGGAETPILAELVCADPFAPAASTGSLTATTITQDASANNGGTASWFRLFRGDNTTWVIDGSVGTAGSDMNLVSTTIVAGQPVQITSFTITLTSQA